LARVPLVETDGLIVIPQDERRACEAAIETVANKVGAGALPEAFGNTMASGGALARFRERTEPTLISSWDSLLDTLEGRGSRRDQA
jgi:hypothetical protein